MIYCKRCQTFSKCLTPLQPIFTQNQNSLNLSKYLKDVEYEEKMRLSFRPQSSKNDQTSSNYHQGRGRIMSDVDNEAVTALLQLNEDGQSRRHSD